MRRILIIDDEEAIRLLLSTIVRQFGYEAVTAENGADGVEKAAKNRFFAVITDLKMPVMDGLEVLERLRKMDPSLPVIIITAHGTVETAVESMKLGATDFIIKPFSPTQIEVILDKIRRQAEIENENVKLKELLRRTSPMPGLVGSDPLMLDVFSLIDKVSATDSTILITGESGTGKELVARAVHLKSGRISEKFVAVNCAAFSENLLESEIFGHEKGAFTGAVSRKLGLLEVASGGTVFLDEIGETSPQFQVRLLRVMQENEFLRVGGTELIRVDTRYLAATNKDLAEEVKKGGFRKDLFYRLNVFPINLPPLRQRRSDIPVLVDHFMEKLAKRRGLKEKKNVAKEVVDLFMEYPWPGNVRELENVLERAMILAHGDVLSLDVLPPELFVSKASDFPQDGLLELKFRPARSSFEAAYLKGLLKKFGGNVTQVAKAAGLRRETVHEKMKRYKISSGEYKTQNGDE